MTDTTDDEVCMKKFRKLGLILPDKFDCENCLAIYGCRIPEELDYLRSLEKWIEDYEHYKKHKEKKYRIISYKLWRKND